MNDCFLDSGDSRLNALLDPAGKQGFRFSSDAGISILLRGGPGTGKSTMCAQISRACVQTQPRRGVAYFCLDEPTAVVRNRLMSLGISCLVTNAYDEPEKTLSSVSRSGEHMCVVLQYYPSMSDLSAAIRGDGARQGYSDIQGVTELVTWKRVCDFVSAVDKWCEALMEFTDCKRWLIVVDSANALLEWDSDLCLRSCLRSLHEGLARELKGQAFLIVSEGAGADSRDSYLADGVVLLESDHAHGSRFLTVAKARDHVIRPIRHRMLIKDGGLAIVPQVTWLSVSAESDKTVRTVFSSEIDSVLLSEGVRQRDVILLIGPHGMQKTALACAFLNNGSDGGEECLYCGMVAGHSLPADASPVEGSSARADGHRCGRMEIAVSDVLEEIEDALLRAVIDPGKGVDRVVLDGCDKLFRRFPFNEVIELLNRFASLCQARGATVLLVCSDTQPEEKLRDLKAMCSTVLVSGAMGMHRVLTPTQVLATEKLRGRTLRSGFIEYWVAEDGSVVADRDGVCGLLMESSGMIGYGPVHVSCFVGETPALQAFADYQHHLLLDVLPARSQDEPGVSFYGESFAQQYLARGWKRFRRRHGLNAIRTFSAAARRRTDIAMLDQPWISEVSHRLVPLDDLLTSSEKKAVEDLPPCVKDAISDAGTLGVPYYHNYFVLAYRRDLVRNAELPSTLSQSVSKDGTLQNIENWAQLFQIANCVATANHKPDDGRYVIPFAYEDSSVDCYATMAIALTGAKVQSICDVVEQWHRLRDWFAHAVRNWTVPLSSCHQDMLFARGSEEVGTGATQRVVPVFSWCWMTTALDGSTFSEQDDIQFLTEPMCPPIAGSWVLALLDGSLNPHRGMDVIRLLRSYESQKEMVRLRCALPPMTRLWTKLVPDAEDLLRFIHRYGISRSRMKDYLWHSDLLADAMIDCLGVESLIHSIRSMPTASRSVYNCPERKTMHTVHEWECKLRATVPEAGQ